MLILFRGGSWDGTIKEVRHTDELGRPVEYWSTFTKDYISTVTYLSEDSVARDSTHKVELYKRVIFKRHSPEGLSVLYEYHIQ